MRRVTVFAAVLLSAILLSGCEARPKGNDPAFHWLEDYSDEKISEKTSGTDDAADAAYKDQIP